jgi:hypothetical protein
MKHDLIQDRSDEARSDSFDVSNEAADTLLSKSSQCVPQRFPAVQPIELATQLPPTWFNSIRNTEGRLDSSPVPLQFRLSKSLADKVEAEVQALVRQQSVSAEDAIARVMQTCMKVDVVYYDGQPVSIFCPESAVHETLVPAPQIVSAEFQHTQQSLTVRSEQTRSTRAVWRKARMISDSSPNDCSDCLIVQVHVTRKLPLSSAHGNRYFRLGFVWLGHGVEHVLFTRAVSVLAKQAPGADRKQKYFASHKAEPTRSCWLLQRAASGSMDLYNSFDSASGPVPSGIGGHKRARGSMPARPVSASAKFARIAAGEFNRPMPGLHKAVHLWRPQALLKKASLERVCTSDVALPTGVLPPRYELEDTASDAQSVCGSTCWDDSAAVAVRELYASKAQADAATAGARGEPVARFFKGGHRVTPPAPLPCRIPFVSHPCSPLAPMYTFDDTPIVAHDFDVAVPPQDTPPQQAPLIATQARSALQAVSTPATHTAPAALSPASTLFQVPVPPVSMGAVSTAFGSSDILRHDSLSRGGSITWGEEHLSQHSLTFPELGEGGSHGLDGTGALLSVALQNPLELARSFSARSGMSAGSGFAFGGQ